jgi:hypothetical protein
MTDDVSDDLVVVDIIIETRYTQDSFMDLGITTSYAAMTLLNVRPSDGWPQDEDLRRSSSAAQCRARPL